MNGRKLVVLGMMSKIPVAGVVWQTMHYLVGLQRLGYDPYYIEAHARAPGMLMRDGVVDDGSALAAAFIEGVMKRFGFDRKWAFHALHADGEFFGLPESTVRRLYRDAALIINLHGATLPLPEHAASGRLVLVETDPVQLQVEIHREQPEALEFLEQHTAWFTFAENYGRDGCRLPLADRFPFRPTRQPVVLDFWRDDRVPRRAFTTIGNWRQDARDIELDGEIYFWSKHHEFEKVLELPRRASQTLELALSRCAPEDLERLEAHGWSVRNALEFSSDVDRYRDYIQRSAGEFTVAKDQNVRLRTGWFSDRSATYLAAGRPVVTQDTGFGAALPTGEGLFAFTTFDDARAALEEIDRDYERQAHAASEISREYFGAERVLGTLLADLGLEDRRRNLVLVPVSRWPTTLPETTAHAVLAGPLPRAPAHDAVAPEASIVVVTFDNLVFNRLCLESVIEYADSPSFELVVVDNGSTDGTVDYLRALAAEHGSVRPVFNDANAGFARALNQGIAVARGRVLVLLNNDTVVAPGWLTGLARHLEDPAVGLVGPVTNRTEGDAKIDTDYTTGAEFLAAAAERARDWSGKHVEVNRLVMFCAALRRDVVERVGLLDERFGLGMFEDDDYVLRLRAAGYRVECAQDVLVHHFGQATLGKLAATGEYGQLFHENRRRFAEKWGSEWQPYPASRSHGRLALVERVRDVVHEAVPPGAAVLVVSRGDEELIDFEGRTGLHFPQVENGVYAGHHPADGAEAIAHLEQLRAAGAEFLVLPQPALWWLDQYGSFRDHLQQQYSLVARAEEACLVFALGGPR
jgi:GT2 family glycosyltransferase